MENIATNANKSLLQEQDREKTTQYWNSPIRTISRTRWWESGAIVRHINHRIAGIISNGTEGGDIDLLRAQSGGLSFQRAISVGCGDAYHELQLLKAGIVEHFDLYEIAPRRVEAIHSRAKSMGLSERITVASSDAFAEHLNGLYDLVYWKDALHHMFPSLDAVQWSSRVLKNNGLFFMNECVAPTYMQWTERQLDLAERIRQLLPPRYLTNPYHPDRLVAMRRERPVIEHIRATDPSECVDSSNILPSIKAVFSNAVVIPTGGIVYMLALNDILANFDEVRDDGLLSALMAIDDMHSDAGDYIYAVAYARKCDRRME